MELMRHLRWTRIDHEAAARPTRPYYPPRPGLPSDRGEHGAMLEDQIGDVVSSVNERRRGHGIAEDELVVLQFDCEGGSQRDAVEKLGLRVLCEEIRTHAVPHERRVVVHFDPDQIQRNTVRAALSQEFAAVRVDDVRGRGGEAAPNKLVAVFAEDGEALRFVTDRHWHRALRLESVGDIQLFDTERRQYLTVQAPDPTALDRFRRELAAYRVESAQVFGLRGLTEIQRKELFDAVQGFPEISPAERAGPNLTADPSFEGVAYCDVDLWHPGSPHERHTVELFTALVRGLGGRITDSPKPVADTMLLCRVEVDASGARQLLQCDLVARAELPPMLEVHDYVGREEELPSVDSEPEEDGPIACSLDSGVVAGHPLLRGKIVVEALDFRTGRDEPSDDVGHGTHVAGSIVYGDVADCMQNRKWHAKVRLLSGKVMSRSAGPDFDGRYRAVFDDEKRLETQIREAVDYFVSNYRCRVFNLSFGNPGEVLARGHQLPWACFLDELARQHDVVFVVSTGNGWPAVPPSPHSVGLQADVFRGLLGEGNQIIDPASAVNALTVGGIARRDDSSPVGSSADRRPPVTAAASGCPSPITRAGVLESAGNGPSRAVKPEVVAYAGNLSVGIADNWNDRDRQLLEPSLNYQWAVTNPFRWDCGTSFAAPQIAHVCALIEHEYREDGISANLIRALTVHSARVDPAVDTVMDENLSDSERELARLRTVGYGRPDAERACFSTDQRVTLVAEDTVPDDEWHVYQIVLPSEFYQGRRRRRIRATLAYDPPVRGTRLEYLSRTMCVGLVRGLPRHAITCGQEDIDNTNSRPPRTLLEWSTVQSRTFSGLCQSPFERAGDEAPATWSVVVQSHSRFPVPEEEPYQRYALVLSIEDEANAEARLYDLVREAVRVTADQRVRIGVNR